MQSSKHIYYKNIKNNDPHVPHIIWGHGWAQTHSTLLPTAISLKNIAHHWLIDLPGFGHSSQPNSVCGSLEYAAIIADWINHHIPSKAKKIWVGHSFGGKIGITLAAKYPTLIDGLFLIAASGIPRKRTIIQEVIVKIKIKIFKFLKYLNKTINNNRYSEWLKTKFGSQDYKNASNPHMRAILVKVVNENLSNIASQISCPTELIYGELDTETPVIIGNIFNKLINNSKLHIILKEDHYSILSKTQHQIAYLLKQFTKKITQGN